MLKMGRPKGSKNTKPTAVKFVKVEDSPRKKELMKDESIEEPKSEVFAVPVVETPLFMCRRCQGAFETTTEYREHSCPAQIYTALLEHETIEYTIEEIGPVAENSKEPIKKPRKPYKKREKKEKTGEKPSKDPVQCPTCQKTFTRKYHLERHLVHTPCNPGNIQKEEFSCEVCKKAFSRIDNLRMHLRAHLGQKSRSRDFQCPYCEKSFYGSSLLNIHVRTHTREKPYLCDWIDCGKGFPSSGALTKHR